MFPMMHLELGLPVAWPAPNAPVKVLRACSARAGNDVLRFTTDGVNQHKFKPTDLAAITMRILSQLSRAVTHFNNGSALRVSDK